MPAQSLGLQILEILVYVVVVGFVLGFAIKLCTDDALRRGKSPLLVSLACILFFPWGLIAWLLFRPKPIDPNSRGGFNLDEYRVQ